MNQIFFWIILVSFGFASWQQWHWVTVGDGAGPMNALTLVLMETASQSVSLAFGLIGSMTFFLGLMKIAENGGLLQVIAKLLKPLLVRLFPDVPPNHPAMGAMVMNLAANALGLGNAATPFGIRAMQSLDELNPHKGTASNAMVLFLAINTSGVTLLPTGIIALRAAAGSADPAGIIPTTLFATACSTAVAIVAAKWLQKRFVLPPIDAEIPPSLPADKGALENSYPLWVSILTLGLFLGCIPLTIWYGSVIAPWIIPTLTAAILVFGMRKKVPVYESFIDGAKEGIQVAFKIIPYLVAILCAIGLLRASGALDILIYLFSFITEPLGFPAEALPMAFLRPLSGSGAYGIVADVLNNPQYGPDSFVGYLVSTIQGSTETTFYVLAVYFGAVQVKRFRHAIAAGILADIAGIAAATFIVHRLY